ncbi:hypothetical protein [Acidovorax cavernicola]|uniref:Lipoprotein n=1 Tax=Acidovorax cavernicola TaxID=1675792 RepID=A0A9X8D8L9_9BURK|nr:hypothetical protein [Acidovorax cavernicola]RIX84706.1 hypothetical protein D3H34_03555 [Acidovorax cavernicola]
MKTKSGIPLLMICFVLAGCASALDLDQKADRTQSPAANARWLTLVMKGNEGVEPLPVTLEYESEKCKEPRSYGVGGQSQSGTMLMRATHFEHVNLIKESVGDAYKARFAIDAGGSCQWKLVSLETSFKYRSNHPLAKGKEATSFRSRFRFGSEKNAVRTPGLRAELSYFPVIYIREDPSKNEVRLRSKSLFLPPSFDPPTSATLYLETNVFGDMAMTVRAAPQDRRSHLVTYPDGATGSSSSEGMVGVEDERMQCLLSSGKSQNRCAAYSPSKD